MSFSVVAESILLPTNWVLVELWFKAKLLCCGKNKLFSEKVASMVGDLVILNFLVLDIMNQRTV
ncbi:hypothetical protein EV207_103223 [Scopulibacillus darangshiensis]|uniref:Uncharacterized protein n=1 Tax=Scopulibacillus darangshiensis TaxID=442528 RepID=A0A4R2PAD9_9BACL|nr:hypothetical protein EV207_103223 [Scopulibacillus darangshiensis]